MTKFEFKYLIFISVTGIILVLDQWTKHLVLANFNLHESFTIVPGFFQLTYVRNPGVAFGFLASAPAQFRSIALTITPVFATIFILYLYRSLKASEYLIQIGYSLIVGGALGNLWDRIQLGYVVDSLDFYWNYGYHFPAFNVADSAICSGVGILLLESFLTAESIGKALRFIRVRRG